MDWRAIEITKRRVLAMSIAVALLLILAVLVYVFFIKGQGSGGPNIFNPGPTVTFQHPLTGEQLAQEIISPLRVYGAMIDNIEAAWPPSGLTAAFLVIEAPVEAGLTRYLAFFSSDKPVDKIGPVRSMRPYFLDWISEFDAMAVHVGGSPAALDKIASSGAFHLNQFYNGDYFWRANGDRFAPHNVYTSTELLGQAVELAELRQRAPEMIYGLWPFRSEAATGVQKGIGVSLEFSADFQARWDYNPTANLYGRFHVGEKDVDDKGEQLTARNVAIVLTDIKVLDAVGRRSVRTVGEGEAFVLQNGEKIAARWKKPSESERLRFYNKQDQEIVFESGTTWIEVLSQASQIKFD